MEGRVEDVVDGSPGEVVLFIDSAKKVTLRSGQDGYFSYGHLVERDRAGTHTVFAVRDGSLFSTLESFTVDAVPSELLLGPPRVLDGKVLCQGTLSAGTRPVRAAPVEIAADGKRLATVQTGDDGTFTAEVRMAPGAYRLRAEFQGEGFPLLRSESEPYEVVVPVPPPASGEEEGFTVDPLSLLVVCGFLCLSGAGAFYYLRHRKHRIRLPRAAIPVPESPPGETPVSGGEEPPRKCRQGPACLPMRSTGGRGNGHTSSGGSGLQSRRPLPCATRIPSRQGSYAPAAGMHASGSSSAASRAGTRRWRTQDGNSGARRKSAWCRPIDQCSVSWRGRTISRAAMVAAAFIVLGVVLALFHLSVTTADYSRYNIEWNGTSVLFDMIDEAGGNIVTDPSLLSVQGDAMLLFVAPEPGLPPSVLEGIRDFLSRGNCVVIASDREEDNDRPPGNREFHTDTQCEHCQRGPVL